MAELTKTAQDAGFDDMTAARQSELLEKYGRTLIRFTTGVADSVKDVPLVRRAFARGCALLLRQLALLGAKPIYRETVGGEGFFALDMEAAAAKRLTVGLEDGSALGRLFVMDVLRPDGRRVEREELGFEERRCFICGGRAAVCAKRHLHSAVELQKKAEEVMRSAIDELDERAAAQQAVRALLYEACTTPKPGLVDRLNSGSHRDMDIFTFMSSAAALWPYFAACTRAGRRTAQLPAPETFAGLRPLGCEAEGEMLAATRGVNTHKGAIFTMGLVCAALGRLEREAWAVPVRVLSEVAAMTKGLTENDFAGLTKENAVTAGQRLFLECGITGVRGEAEAGLPTVRDIGLPALEDGFARGLGADGAGCAALLHILAESTDTNMIARGGREKQLAVSEDLRAMLRKEPFPKAEALLALDEHFIKENLSPGGSADLLAVCYLLYFLKHEADENV